MVLLHRRVSGKECIKILCNKFGFHIVRVRGSHFVLRKEDYGTVVPLHNELRIGTLKNILEMAEIDEEEFEKYL